MEFDIANEISKINQMLDESYKKIGYDINPNDVTEDHGFCDKYGSPFDRGKTDSYYSRPRRPHKVKGREYRGCLLYTSDAADE